MSETDDDSCIFRGVFYLYLAPMRTNNIFTFWTSAVQFKFEGAPCVPCEKSLYYYT